MAADPISLAVFNSLFSSIAEEMGAVLVRSSLSPNIRERRDLSCAVFDALPLLKSAQSVTVVWIDPQHDGEAAGDLPGADICAALARHGVKCEATQNVRPAEDIGGTLLSTVKSCGGDMLVMGCYGHSRMREFVFGGATRHILEHMTVPVLMSH